jgi:hypothetical protein
LTFLCTVQKLYWRPAQDLRKQRPGCPFNPLLFAADNPIPPEYYISLGNADELLSTVSFFKFLAPKKQHKEITEFAKEAENLRREVLALFVQYQVGAADRLDAQKLLMELTQLQIMAHSGLPVIKMQPSKENISRAAGFRTYPDFLEAIQEADAEFSDWIQTLTEGIPLVYTNGVAVWQEWTHNRRKKAVKMPLAIVSSMVIRSELVKRTLIPKTYNSKVSKLQHLIRGLRITMGSHPSLTEPVTAVESNLTDMHEVVNLLKTVARYDPFTDTEIEIEMMSATGIVFAEALRKQDAAEVASILQAEALKKLLITKDAELRREQLKRDLDLKLSQEAQLGSEGIDRVIYIVDSDNETESSDGSPPDLDSPEQQGVQAEAASSKSPQPVPTTKLPDYAQAEYDVKERERVAQLIKDADEREQLFTERANKKAAELEQALEKSRRDLELETENSRKRLEADAET